jgi:hypothetical protein
MQSFYTFIHKPARVPRDPIITVLTNKPITNTTFYVTKYLTPMAAI